ncbi:hypothetical protein HHL11_19330 [Ramlibacter sp. G-1-2-2]|uniref:Uncharacterized protein n=1 Tax=Ramlibacter agri TaxID=2728837 RepID=A0A848H921_9BURK|nr:hypothetical protein [Ramlibacter agri]NML45910.1 hypothetical protein [Ramlibacter agri]
MIANEIKTLEALLADVTGNLLLGDAKKTSGYLKSISLLSGALARQSWQQFELDVIDEMREVSGRNAEDALKVKTQLAQREFDLSTLEVKLTGFLAQVDSGCFATKTDAAKSLRALADALEQAESLLFPAPATKEQLKAYAASIGATFSEAGSLDELLAELKGETVAKPVRKATQPKKAADRRR